MTEANQDRELNSVSIFPRLTDDFGLGFEFLAVPSQKFSDVSYSLFTAALASGILKAYGQATKSTRLRQFKIPGYALNRYRSAQDIARVFYVTDKESFNDVKEQMGEINKHFSDGINKLLM